MELIAYGIPIIMWVVVAMVLAFVMALPFGLGATRLIRRRWR